MEIYVPFINIWLKNVGPKAYHSSFDDD